MCAPSRPIPSTSTHPHIADALIVCPYLSSNGLRKLSCSFEAYVATNPENYRVTIAVDGGAQWFYEQGIVPDYAVGDFDSIATDVYSWLMEDGENSGLEIMQVPSEKDFSDLDLAIHLAENLGVESIDILGALGGRIDHQLCVLGALRTSSIPFLRLIGTEQALCLLRPNQSLQLLPCQKPLTFSVIGVEDSIVSITGARWNLDQANIGALSSLGLSNKLDPSTEKTEIIVHQGNAFVSVSNDKPTDGLRFAHIQTH